MGRGGCYLRLTPEQYKRLRLSMVEGLRNDLCDFLRKRPTKSASGRIDSWHFLFHDGLVSDAFAVEAGGPSLKRLRRTREEKRRIVEATFAPGASIARVAREHGVNANQVFQWRHEYRKGSLEVGRQAQTRLGLVTVTAEPNSVTLSGIASAVAASGSIHIELPGRAVISVEARVDPDLVRALLRSLLR
jgi:transposase